MMGQRTVPMIKSVELPNRIQLQYVEQGDPVRAFPCCFCMASRTPGTPSSWC